jgi:hypothetical protein
MEVTLLGSSIKIKSKQATFLVDPARAKGKLQADAAINLYPEITIPDIEGLRIILQGPGEYEVGGVKITGIGTSEKIQYYFFMDNIRLLLLKASAFKGKDVRDVDIVIIDADEQLDQTVFAGTNASSIIFYGLNAQNILMSLEKNVQPVTKYTMTKDKLPSEKEVVLLA